MMPHEDPPTRAEAEADEHARDLTVGMTRCRYGCPTYFHGDDTDAARLHYATAHRPEE